MSSAAAISLVFGSSGIVTVPMVVLSEVPSVVSGGVVVVSPVLVWFFLCRGCCSVHFHTCVLGGFS